MTSIVRSHILSAPRSKTPRPALAVRLLSALTGAFLLAGSPCAAQLAKAPAPAEAPAAQRLNRDFGQVPLSFETNQGQTDARVQYLSRGKGYSLYLTANEAMLRLSSSNGGRPQASTLTMKLKGANHDAVSAPDGLLPGTANYFYGADKSKWKAALPTYKRVSYTGVYPGVDLVYYGNQRELEYDFVVAPGADPQRIALTFTGAKPSIERRSGDLMLATSAGKTRFHKPVVFQQDGDRKVPVAGSYRIANNEVHFALGRYDKSKPLVIDPVLTYMTYLGGTINDTITGMAVDSAGSVYVVGTTNSIDFPVKTPYKGTDPNTIAPSNPLAIFVSKFNAAGTALVYSTYLGSSEYTYGNGIAVDSGGNAYVVGYTAYGDYPTTPGAYQTICGANNYIPQGSTTAVRSNGCVGAGQADSAGVLTKLNPAGTALVYSTYLSGGNGNQITAVAVDAAGEAYVTGVTNAVCPGPYNANGSGYQAYFCIAATANASEAANTNARGDTYAFLVKFNAQGSGLLYSTMLGNHNPVGHYNSGIKANALTLDAAGNAYVTGNMDANYFIMTTTGSLQPSRVAGSLPAFVAKFNPAGTSTTSLAYSTYLSGTSISNENATGIAVDGSGNAFITGYTNSCTFPTTAGAFSTVPGGYVSANVCAGGFLSKLNPTGSSLVWSTYTGANGANGRNNDDNDAVALGPDGSVYVTGDEQGVGLSPTVNPIFTQSESHFTYIKHFTADGSAVTFGSAVGGTTDATSIPAAIYVDPANNIYLAGSTNSATWPTTAGAFQKNSASPGVNYSDGYVVKIAPLASSSTALTLPAGTVTAGQSVKLSAKVTGQTGVSGTPTGTATFFSGTSQLGTGTLDSTGTATYTVASVSGTTYSYTASYAGDTNFAASASAVQTLVVTPATPAVTLTAPASALVGASVTLGVTVAGSAGTPTGSVVFKDGTATLSTVALASGAASFSTTSLAAGAHSITASYGGDANYAATVSAVFTITINVAPAISFAATPASLTIARGSSGTVTITGTPVGGYSGTASFTCGTLPAGASCTFTPATLTFSGSNTAQSVSLLIGTVTTAALVQPKPLGNAGSGIVLALLMLPVAWYARRQKVRAAGRSLLLLCLLTLSAGLLGLTGCASNTFGSKTTTTTAAGSYTIAVTVTTAGSTATVNVPLTVQ